MSSAAEDGNYTGVFRRGARGTIDIIADILSLCNSWNKRTKIVYKANLSHQMLKFYLWHMVELGLIEESGEMRFKTTEKGRAFLLHYQNMAGLLAGLNDVKNKHFVPHQGKKSSRKILCKIDLFYICSLCSRRKMGKKKDHAFIVSAAIMAAIVAMAPAAPAALAAKDLFGIEKVYADADDKSAWYMKDNDPEPTEEDYDDSFPFRFGTVKTIEYMDEVGDGVWRMDVTTGSEEHGVRMHVYHPDDDEWKNVEVTGYFKMLESNDQITMIARHGKDYHGNDGCDALGYYGMINADGDAYFKKKLYHGDGGYSDSVAEKDEAVDDPEGQWLGVKFIVYNLGSNKVTMELWADESDEGNNWKKVTEYVDEGDLEINGDSDCDRDKDYVTDEAQPRVTFRVDGSEFEFKNLSVREIQT